MPPNYFGSEGNDEDRKKDDSKTTRNVAPHPPQAAEPRAQLRAAPSLALGLARGGGCWGCPPSTTTGTASSHSAECVSTGTQSGRLHMNTDRVFPVFLKKKKREKTIQYRKPVCSHFNISNSFDVMLHSSLVSNPKFCKEKNQRCANKAGNQVHAPVCWHIAAPRNRSTESKQCSGTEGAALDTESKVYGLY